MLLGSTATFRQGRFSVYATTAGLLSDCASAKALYLDSPILYSLKILLSVRDGLRVKKKRSQYKAS